jgi:hypothetical protein
MEYLNMEQVAHPDSQYQGQAWNISKINNKYLIGHQEGRLFTITFVFKIKLINGGWNLIKSNIDNLSASHL